MKRLFALVLISGLVLAAACSSDGDSSSGGGDQAHTDAVKAVVDDVIVPAYADIGESAKAAQDAVDALCAAPSAATISVARTTMLTAWQAWEFADTFDIGPATDRRSNTYIAYRVAPGRVDAALAGTPPADAETARNRTASNQRGYGAVDHLLVDDPAAYDAARCTYLTSLMALIAEESAAVADAWAGDGRDEMLDMDPNDVIDTLVNMQISFLESSSRTYSDGNPPTPAEAVEIPQAVAGLGKVYEAGLDSLLDEKLADTIASEVAAVLDVPVNDAGDAVEALRATITTEVVSALDVTIGFSENDGDSSS